MCIPFPESLRVMHKVTIWGARGSIPTPGPDTARYGGNTACISIAGRGDRLVILDAGSGLRPLGHDLMKQRNGTLSADILLSHTHWDHIQGLPFFKPLSSRNTSVNIYGAAQEGVPLKDILGRQMDPMVFPVPLNALAASLAVIEISQGDFDLGGLQGVHYSSTASRYHSRLPARSVLRRSRAGISHRQRARPRRELRGTG